MKRQSLTTSSLPLQVFVYYNFYYACFFFVLSVLLYIYKGGALPFPREVLTQEVVVMILFFVFELARLKLGSMGNKTQRVLPLLGFLLASGPSLVAFVFYLRWQTYITRVDVIASVIGLILVCAEMMLALFAMFVFWQSKARFGG